MLARPDFAIHVAWAAWALSWWLAAFWRRRAVRRPPSWQELVHLAPTVVGVGLLFSTHAPLDDPGRQVFNNHLAAVEPIRLWAVPLAFAWACFGLSLLGFLFCWWARVTLGALWSGSITLKSDHKVVDTGPYRLVRHQIYTGLILAAAATAAEKATIVSIAGAALIVFGFWLKARFEERFLREALGPEAYDSYAARTPMLVPIRL